MGFSDQPRREQLANSGLWLPLDRNGSHHWQLPSSRDGRDGLELARRGERSGDRVEDAAELAANERHCTDDHDGDERGDEAVLNGGRTIAIPGQLGHEVAHESDAPWGKWTPAEFWPVSFNSALI